MAQKIWKKRILFLMMALFLGMMSAIGIFFLANKGERAVTALGYDEYIDWIDNSSVYIGKILDADGEELWTKDFPGYEDTYNIVGELKTNYMAENTVTVAYSDVLLGMDTYNLIGGEDSLSDAGQDINLTIRHKLSESVYNYMKENGVKSGSALFAEADTGKILAAVSLPGASPCTALDELEDGALLNKNLRVTIPGSTMKIVTTALLAAKCGEELRQETAECIGTYPLLDGDVICSTQCGLHDIESALGYSCNIFFAQKIINILDKVPEGTWESLEKMGFKPEKQEIFLDRLRRISSSTGYTGNPDFSGTWSLIGQGTTQTSPIDMVRIVSAIVNGGAAAEPYLVENIRTVDGTITEKHEVKRTELMSEATAQLTDKIWRNAYNTYYPSGLYDEQITMAKTGTAQYADGSESSLLMGYIENLGVAFYIEIKNWDEAQISPADVVNHALNAGL